MKDSLYPSAFVLIALLYVGAACPKSYAFDQDYPDSMSLTEESDFDDIELYDDAIEDDLIPPPLLDEHFQDDSSSNETWGSM